MTTPDVDQEIERLFSVTREATLPDAGARERIRGALTARLTADVPAPRSALGKRAWLGVGAALIGVSAVALWVTRTAESPHVLASAPVASVVAPSRLPTPTPAPAPTPKLEALPSAALAVPDEPSASARAVAPTPSHAAKLGPAATQSAEPADELSLVRAMQQALRSGNANQALTLAAEHARRFPGGALVEEREGVRALARCQLAAPASRPAILSAFTQRFQSSPYTARVKAACQ